MYLDVIGTPIILTQKLSSSSLPCTIKNGLVCVRQFLHAFWSYFGPWRHDAMLEEAELSLSSLLLTC